MILKKQDVVVLWMARFMMVSAFAVLLIGPENVYAPYLDTLNQWGSFFASDSASSGEPAQGHLHLSFVAAMVFMVIAIFFPGASVLRRRIMMVNGIAIAMMMIWAHHTGSLALMFLVFGSLGILIEYLSH